MQGSLAFERALQAYRGGCDTERADWGLMILAKVIEWVHQQGHGDITLHAVDHRLGEQITTRTILKVKRQG